MDCGGPSAPKCALDATCAVDTDCTSAICSLAKTCVRSASCRGTANGRSGLDTCGTGETGEVTAKHESCCRSLPLPTRTERSLDKYEITGGRLRSFIESIAAQNSGVPDVRGFAKSFAAANPSSQLASVASEYPGLLDILPNQAGPTAPLPLPVHLGAFPLDPINDLDGCFTAPNKNGHATYWQPKSDLEPFGIGQAGVRKYPRDVLDEKPVNCVMPLVLATFCAWDGGELARTADYHEVWGRHPQVLGTATVYVPWASILSVGQFGWRNGIGTATCPSFPWPGCVDPPFVFYASPMQDLVLADDATPVFAAPGRYPLDVTMIRSANGEGWVDVGGNLMDAAWPVGSVNPGPSATTNVCDVSASPGPGDTACTRRTIPGVQRYAGALPHIALVGYSVEGHMRRSEAYLASTTGAESLIAAGDLKPVTFQYGKVGGRCVRPSAP